VIVSTKVLIFSINLEMLFKIMMSLLLSFGLKDGIVGSIQRHILS